MATVGTHIKLLRKQKGMTQEEIAQRLSVSRQTISNYENGKSQPDINMLKEMANVLGTDINSLIYGGTALQFQRKQIWKQIIMLLNLFASGMLVGWLNFRTREYASITYNAFPQLFVKNLLQPMWLSFAGYILIRLLQILFVFQRLQDDTQKVLKILAFVLIVVLVLVEIGVWTMFLHNIDIYLPLFILAGVLYGIQRRNEYDKKDK